MNVGDAIDTRDCAWKSCPDEAEAGSDRCARHRDRAVPPLDVDAVIARQASELGARAPTRCRRAGCVEPALERTIGSASHRYRDLCQRHYDDERRPRNRGLFGEPGAKPPTPEEPPMGDLPDVPPLTPVQAAEELLAAARAVEANRQIISEAEVNLAKAQESYARLARQLPRTLA